MAALHRMRWYWAAVTIVGVLRYIVLVDDNFHYQEEDERSKQGTYPTAEEALAVCRGIVDRFLDENHRPGMSGEALFVHYTSFGDDPFIVVLDGVDESAKFSAWTYAKERCRVVCDPDRI
jgi:hypothetical protein